MTDDVIRALRALRRVIDRMTRRVDSWSDALEEWRRGLPRPRP